MRILDLKWLNFTILFYLLLLGFLNYYLPFSMLFDLLHDKKLLIQEVERLNEIRLERSHQYFSTLTSSQSLDFYNSLLKKAQINFAVGIISIKRGNYDQRHQKSSGYLFQSASALDSQLKKSSIFNNSISFICNVDLHPSQHKDAVELYSYLPYVERYGKNSLGISKISIPSSDKSFHEVSKHISVYEKETYDYVFCLLAAAELKPHFIILVEEDIIPHPKFAEFLDHLVNVRLKHQDFKEFAFVKFFFPVRWQGFGFSFIELCDLISFCIVGATILCLVYHRCLSSLIFINSGKKFMIGFFISLITCYMVGRQNLNEFRRLSNYFYRMKSAQPCCTQAMLYPAMIAEDLSQFLISESKSTHTDLIIWDYVVENQIPAYQIEPNLFYHTGFHTTLAKGQKDPVEFIIM